VPGLASRTPLPLAIGGGSLVPSCRRRSPGSAWRRDGGRGRPADGTRRRHDHQPSAPERGVAGREEREGADAWRDGVAVCRSRHGRAGVV